MAEIAVRNLPVEKRLEIVFQKAARLLPAEMGNQLMAFISPSALTTMGVVLVAWAGSHFFGVGEIADVVLLILGWVAVGGVAVEAGDNIIDFIKKTLNANTERDCDDAARHLAKAVTLLGVQLVLALLLRKKPGDTFKIAKSKDMPRFASAFPVPLARNMPLRYRPKLIFTKKLNFRDARTNPLGDIRVGTGARFGNSSKEELLAAIYHEKVHQFMTPKLYLFRNLRIYMKQSAYRKSFILRYLEEALAETIGLLRAHGMNGPNILKGLKFPIENTGYQITFSALGHEAKGILLGPVVAGGMIYNVFHGFNDIN